jgi:hypothetical protein
LHGTINVILANQNGLVAVTDSRLSRGDVPVGSGHKLFKIDDQTICTIAGSYAQPGAAVEGVGYVGSAVFSKSAREFASQAAKFANLDLLQKAVLFGNTLAFTFTAAMNLHDVQTGHRQLAEPIEITMAGYSHGKLSIVQLTLAPQIIEGFTRFVPSEPAEKSVNGTSFLCALGGIKDLASEVLRDPDRYVGIDPAVKRYADARKTHQLQELSVSDMLSLARALEFQAAFRFPNVIGGSEETAVLENNRIVQFDSNLSAREIDLEPEFLSSAKLGFIIFANNRVTYLDDSPCLPSRRQPGGIIVVNSDLKGCRLSLQDAAITNTRLDGVALQYSGGPFAIFEHNAVINCSLHLGPNVKPNDPFILQMRNEYPDLSISRDGAEKN